MIIHKQKDWCNHVIRRDGFCKPCSRKAVVNGFCKQHNKTKEAKQ